MNFIFFYFNFSWKHKQQRQKDIWTTNNIMKDEYSAIKYQFENKSSQGLINKIFSVN